MHWDSKSISFVTYDRLATGLELTIAGMDAMKPDGTKVELPASSFHLADKSEIYDLYAELDYVDEFDNLKVKVDVSRHKDTVTAIHVVCDSTRWEANVPLEQQEAEIHIPIQNVRNNIFLRAVSIDSGNSGNGLELASSPHLIVRVDEPTHNVGQGLRVEFDAEPFSETPSAIVFFDTRRDEPRVVLNSQIPDLENTLRSKRRGLIGAVRTFLLSAIEARVLISIAEYLSGILGQVGSDERHLEIVDIEDLFGREVDQNLFAILLRALRHRRPTTAAEVVTSLVDVDSFEMLKMQLIDGKSGGSLSGHLRRLLEAVASQADD